MFTKSETGGTTMRDFIIKHPAALIFGALIIINIMFATGNIILLYQTSQKNATADATLESAELRLAEAKEFNDQATFTATSGKLSQYQEKYQPNLVRWTNPDGTETLFYSMHISVSGPKDDEEDAYRWFINTYRENDTDESFEMPSYAESGDTTYYYFAYCKNHSNSEPTPTLQSYRRIQVGDQIYEIECDYRAVPSDVNINNATDVNNYIEENTYSQLTFFHYDRKPPVLNESPISEIAYNDASVYSIEEEQSPCGCENCCCDVCTCTEK